MTPSDRHIAHLDLDSFYVSVERLRNPDLMGKPVLIGGSGDRGVVASCSYEARKFGIHSAMPMKTARKLCSHAVIINGDMEMYVRHSSLVTEIIKNNVPLFEKASIDEFYVDMSGMDRFFGCMQYIGQLKKLIKKESGLPISYALSSNKLLSKVATNEVKPNGEIEIPFGTEKAYLAPLSISKIPGIGKKTAGLLTGMGITTVRMLSETPIETLQRLFGKTGAELWKKANGIDKSPVVPYHDQKSISTETTFEQDVGDVSLLHAEIARMAEKTGFELRGQNKRTGCITIKLRYANFETFTKQQTLPYTNADQMIIRTAISLFTGLYDRHMPIRLIGVRVTRLIPDSYQTDLFDTAGETTKLYHAIDSIKRKFGEGSVVNAAGLSKHHNGNH